MRTPSFPPPLQISCMWVAKRVCPKIKLDFENLPKLRQGLASCPLQTTEVIKSLSALSNFILTSRAEDSGYTVKSTGSCWYCVRKNYYRTRPPTMWTVLFLPAALNNGDTFPHIDCRNKYVNPCIMSLGRKLVPLLAPQIKTTTSIADVTKGNCRGDNYYC